MSTSEFDRKADIIERTLRDAGPWIGHAHEGWQSLAKAALDAAGIETTPEQFRRAWRALWQSATDGYSYRSDAVRILNAVGYGSVTG